MTAGSLPPPLHARLTVVRADDAPVVVARRLANALVSEAVDLRAGRPGVPTVLTGDDILADARRRAAAAFESRVAVRDEAVARRTGLAARRTHLLERAEWCEQTAGTARALDAALAQAETQVAEARVAVEEAARRRDRVAEQRAITQAAVEEARLELETLDSAGLDETGVRRELEGATRAEREAAAALEAAEAEVAALRDRIADLDATHAALLAERDALLAPVDGADPGAERAVRDALAMYEDLARQQGLSPAAGSLADALARVTAELARLRESLPEPPTDEELTTAEADVAAARRGLDLARASRSSFDGPPPEWWVELTALHGELVEAEAALADAGKRKVKSARLRYEQALEAERARLDELGFDSYLDALMSGGRQPNQRATDERIVADATAALAAAEQHLDRMRADLVAGAPIIDRIGEQEELLDAAARLLGCDPAGRAVELLAVHPDVPTSVLGDLADALHDLGIETAGVGVGPAARRWVDERDAARDPRRIAAIDARIAELTGERNAAEAALVPATARAERAAGEAAAGARTVASLEAELRARAGDDRRMLERITAARELRDQVEAVEAQLADAEADALQRWASTTEVLTEAEQERDRIEADRADLARRASRAAADLPADRRPAFDLLSGLSPLGAALRAEAVALGVTLDLVEADVAEAVAACGAGPSNPTAIDVEAATRATVDAAPDGLLIVAEPFEGLAAEDVEHLLDVLLDVVAGRPAVLVTAEMAAVGWAIGLPSAVGTLVPARSLDPVLARAGSVHAD